MSAKAARRRWARDQVRKTATTSVVLCGSGKKAYQSESVALESLIRVRADRLRSNDVREPECRVYPCGQCGQWHLTSQEPHPEDLFTPEIHTGETWETYAHRLEKRIAEQRAQLLSLHAIGAGGTNRQSRKRIAALTVALGRMAERWENERRNREALVARLAELEGTTKRRRRWWRAA